MNHDTKILFILAVLLGVGLAASFYKALRTGRLLKETQNSLAELTKKFSGILDLESEMEKKRSGIANLEQEHHILETSYQDRLKEETEKIRVATLTLSQDLEALRASYREKKLVYDRLLSEIAIFDDRLAFAEMGVYEPHFDYTDSEEYKKAIKAVQEKQKELITQKTAVYCKTNWSVDGSTSKGQAMTNRNIKLTLRAFNNECDVAVANTRWNNVKVMEKRILNARNQIEKLNASNTIFIADEFVKLKLHELYLTHEYREKLKAEREERAEAARAARQEQKFLRDMERAEEEEAYYAKLLAKAKTEAEGVVGQQLEAFSEQVKILERDLAKAHEKVERAKAMAERTRSGYVYIISNIGSFGEGIIKIGSTRRLDPLDRVLELGDASVPFRFDTHAIIYSEDAPALERSLHNEFEANRINTQNYRKEFFRASLEDVETALKRLAPEAPFFRDIEAQEYHETLARRKLALENLEHIKNNSFPDEL